MKRAVFGPVLLLLVLLSPGIANAQYVIGESAAVSITFDVDCKFAWTAAVGNAPLLDSISTGGGAINIIKGGRANNESATGDMFVSSFVSWLNLPGGATIVAELDPFSFRSAVVLLTPVSPYFRAMRIERSLTEVGPGVCRMDLLGVAHVEEHVDFASLMQNSLENLKAYVEYVQATGEPLHSFPKRQGQ